MDAPLAVSESEFDAGLGVYTLFFRLPREEVVFFKAVVESYEDLAGGRTMERFCGEDGRDALIVLLAVPDTIEWTARVLGRLCRETLAVPVASTPELRRALGEALLLDAGEGGGDPGEGEGSPPQSAAASSDTVGR